MKKVHIALDFDRTLATMEDDTLATIGQPIQPMIDQVKKWVEKGHEITIFTARVSKWFKEGGERPDVFIMSQKMKINQFLVDNGLPIMKITANKSPLFTHFVDDKAVKVLPNKGIVITTDENL